MSWSGYIPGHLANDPDFIRAYYAGNVEDEESPNDFGDKGTTLYGEDREIISSG